MCVCFLNFPWHSMLQRSSCIRSFWRGFFPIFCDKCLVSFFPGNSLVFAPIPISPLTLRVIFLRVEGVWVPHGRPWNSVFSNSAHTGDFRKASPTSAPSVWLFVGFLPLELHQVLCQTVNSFLQNFLFFVNQSLAHTGCDLGLRPSNISGNTSPLP